MKALAFSNQYLKSCGTFKMYKKKEEREKRKEKGKEKGERKKEMRSKREK
jgi:hypothetical protein